MSIEQLANPFGHKKTAESRIARLTAQKRSAEERITELVRENDDLRAKLEAILREVMPAQAVRRLQQCGYDISGGVNGNR